MAYHAAGMAGTLQVISTPIGNLADLSERAAEALRAADVVACEDTRHTGRLLAHLGIRSRLVSLHEHNETRRIAGLLELLAEDQRIALVSDAGTPLVSDPGFALTRAAIAAGARVEALPGPSAVLAALVVSGLEPLPFTFAGFPPPKAGRRRRFYERFAALDHTVVFYESPHRVLASLADALTVFGDRRAALCRELTKLHEETLRGRLSDLEAELSQRPSIKGELALVVGRDDGEGAETPARD